MNNKNWHVAIRVEPRDTYALPVEEDESPGVEHYPEVTEVTSYFRNLTLI
ncbi:hypothetical protein LINPERHAP1_LOCUS3696 [Linum perenne]